MKGFSMGLPVYFEGINCIRREIGKKKTGSHNDMMWKQLIPLTLIFRFQTKAKAQQIKQYNERKREEYAIYEINREERLGYPDRRKWIWDPLVGRESGQL